MLLQQIKSRNPSSDSAGPRLVRFTNCRLLRKNTLERADLWFNTDWGRIIAEPLGFYSRKSPQVKVIDLNNSIVSPGWIDCQLNGAFGLNFSEVAQDMTDYTKRLGEVNHRLLQTGVTSYLPTITSQKPAVYKTVLPLHKPQGVLRLAELGAESLGAHCEGPFLNTLKNGAHNVDVLIEAQSFTDIEACYGKENLVFDRRNRAAAIKMITAAPELGRMTSLIPELASQKIVFSIGHTDASYEQAATAIRHGASMVTHLFNAMRPLHHRNPGVLGVLGHGHDSAQPFFGVVADGIHVHPATVNLVFKANMQRMILVTDGMHLLGSPDGVYQWMNGGSLSTIKKLGYKLTLEGSDTIAGSCVTLLESVNNLIKWSGASIPTVLSTVTAAPAYMLGLRGVKGTLDIGADADFLILSEVETMEGGAIVIDEVWKFGKRMYQNSQSSNQHIYISN